MHEKRRQVQAWFGSDARHLGRSGATERCSVGEDGIETIELVLITSLVMIILLVAIPLVGNGVANALAGVAQAISDAGAGIAPN